MLVSFGVILIPVILVIDEALEFPLGEGMAGEFDVGFKLEDP